jgi:LacI family transcriptional regulator
MYPWSVTIYDIAKEAGVSGSTVSRVLNGKPGVNAQTRKKVQALLETHHFFANEAARGLVMQTPRMMGILVADIRNSHYAEGAYLIAQEFANHGYGALICNTGDDDPSKVDSLRVLASRRVDGVALIGSTFQCDAVRDALQLYFATTPVVIANGYVDLPQAYGVVADEAEGIASCVRLLLGQGRRHLAFVNGTDTPSNRIKQQGFPQRGGKDLPSLPMSFRPLHRSIRRGMTPLPACLSSIPRWMASSMPSTFWLREVCELCRMRGGLCPSP